MTFHDGRAGDIRYSRGNDSHLRSLIGDTPWTAMQDGLGLILDRSPPRARMMKEI